MVKIINTKNSYFVQGLLTILCLFPFGLHAETLTEAEKIERAQTLVIEARAAATKGEHQISIKKFEAANDLMTSPDNLFAIASIYERIEGACEKALNAWQRFETLCRDCSLKQKGQSRRNILKKQCSVNLTVDSKPIGATLIFDGVEKGKTPLTFGTLAGRHTLTLHLDKHHSTKENIILLKGSISDLKSINLTPLIKNKPLATNQAKPASALVNQVPQQTLAASQPSKVNLSPIITHEDLYRKKTKTTAWILLGAGALVTSLGIWSYLSASSDIDQINQATEVKSLESASQSNYQLKEAFGYIGMGVGIGLSSWGLIKFNF